MALKHTSKHNSWGFNGIKYQRLIIVEYLPPNKLRRSQTSILYIKFPVFFFAGEQYMKTPVKVSMKVQRELLGLFLGCQSRTFLRDKTIFDFFGRGAWHHVCNAHTCRQKISYFHVFLKKGRLWPPTQGKNIVFSGKKYHLSR